MTDQIAQQLRVGRGRRGQRFLKQARVVELERRALEYLVRGWTVAQIATELGMSNGGVYLALKRGLARRAETEGKDVEAARALMVARYEKLLNVWMPAAIGDYLDEETGEQGQPDSRATDQVLKILAGLAKVQGLEGGPRQGQPDMTNQGIHVHLHQPDERAELQRQILYQLSRAAEKAQVIDGELANAETSLGALTGTEVDDRPPPPPIGGPTP